MPSPFPGLDPYLEHPALWPGVHQGLITYMQAALNMLLPPHYAADIGERLYVVQPERSIYPDVVVLEHPPVIPPTTQTSTSAAGTTVSDPPWILTLHPVESRAGSAGGLRRCYDAAAYARRLDYHRDPSIAPPQDDAAWVAALLHERGLRM